MMAEALRALRWSLSLGAKIGRVVPWWTALVVFIALISQISMLLASFLPLKVVILLGSDGMPRYLPSGLASIGKNQLIVWFSLLTVGFFGVHLLAEKLVTQVTERATRLLMQRSHKLVLFERQDEVAAGAYQRFSRALAGGFFVGLAFFVAILIYPEMAGVIAGYLLLCTLAFLGLSRLSMPFRQTLEEQPGPKMKLAAGTGFFVSFGYLVLDFIVFSPPGVLSAIVSLLLTRMIMQKFSSGILDVHALNRQRPKLDALFFHGKIFLPQANDGDRGVWAMIKPEEREAWINALFKEFVDDWQGIAQVEWLQSGVPNMIALFIKSKAGHHYLIKLFDSGRQSLAVHEATLTGENIKFLPAPKLIANTQVKQFKCLIYELPEGRCSGRLEVKHWMEPVRGLMMSVEPPPSLVQQYGRSRPSLWQRLDAKVVERLVICARSDSERLLSRQLQETLFELQEHLRQLPPVLVNPDINVSSLYFAHEDRLLLNWGRWSIDPVGSGWQDGEKQLDQLAGYLEEAARSRSSLVGVFIESVELSALTFAFEAKCSRQLFSEAFELLPGMLERLDRVSNRTDVDRNSAATL
jgi:hypothetical protein